MKRQIGTALSVLGLLAVGTAAAAINVRMLHGSGSEAATFEMRMAGDVTPLASSGSTAAQPADSATPPQPVVPDPGMGSGKGFDGPRRDGDESATVGGPGSVGSVPGDGDGDGHRGFGDGDRPPLTDAQLTLLRVAAMVRLSPETVQAVAKGDNTDAATVAAVTRAAAAVGTTLKDLAAVTMPAHHERGHGGPGGDGDHGGPGGPNGTLAPVSGTTYDD